MKQPTISISRRYSDSVHYGERLQRKLQERFRGVQILGVPAGVDAPQDVSKTVVASDVLITLIGRHFFYDREGQSTIAGESDHMRVAIATALNCGVHVIPVLLPYCRIPRAEELPADIKAFASLTPIEVDILSWKKNSDILLDIIHRLPPKRTQLPSARLNSAKTLTEHAPVMRHAGSLSLREHLRSLPLSHARPPTAPRPAAWLRSAAAAGVVAPLHLVQDLGALLTQARSQLTLERPAHLPAGIDTSAYLGLLVRLAAHPCLREVSAWDISDAVTGVIIARLVEGLSFPEVYDVPGGVEAVGFAERLGVELGRADPGFIWRTTPLAERPFLGQLLPPASLARIEANLRRLDINELRFLHRYGTRRLAAPDPRELLDLFNLLDLPPAVCLALTQVLRLLPRVSRRAGRGGGAQTYAMGGYAGLTHRGSLDSLVPTELAYPSQMLLHRMLNQEALYYGREAEQEQGREVAYIVTQAGLDVRGDVDVLARALTLALAEAMRGRGYEVQHSFAGSRWTEASELTRSGDVQRVLYYRDEGALRAAEMLVAVLGQLRAWRERYRKLHVIWVVGEHWDVDDYEANRDLYAALNSAGQQQAWLIRLGAADAQRSPGELVAAKVFGRAQVVNTDALWERHEPPVVFYAPPAEAAAEASGAEEPWTEPVTLPSRVLLVCSHYGSQPAAEVEDFITREMRMRGHMVMGDNTLTNHDSWIAALRNVGLVMPMISEQSAKGAVIPAAIRASRALTRLGEGPRMLPVHVDGQRLPNSLKGVLETSECFEWRGAEDNAALLRAMLEAIAPAQSRLRFDGLYYPSFRHPTELRDWFRFDAEGSVVSMTTTEGTPAQVARWLSEELRDGRARSGRYEANGATLRMELSEQEQPYNVRRYTGVIGDNALRLNDYQGSARASQVEYQFAAVAEVTEAAASSLHFDGGYATQVECVDWTHPEKDWSWMAHCLKFNPDGTVFHAMVLDINSARNFVPSDSNPRGVYRVEGANVEMVFSGPGGETYNCRGVINGDTISVSGTFSGEYQYAAPSAPQTGLRFDGVYTNKSIYIPDFHPERGGGWDRYTLRFRSDGTVSYLYTATGYDTSPVEQPGEDDPRGTYRVNGSILDITMTFRNGETREWYGTIERESVTLTMGDGLKQFDFVGDGQDEG